MTKRQGGFLIARIHQLSGRVFARKLTYHGLGEINPAQGRILFVLWQEDNLTMGELSKRTSLSKSTLTSMLDRLEASGHVSRVAVSEDRRLVLVRLADASSGLRARYEAVSEEMVKDFYAGLSTAQIDQFEMTLSHILQNLSDLEQ
jgi:DNA-binding MarR family transcriptional regulator